MLQKLDVATKMLLDLADDIEKSDKFDMRQWCDCIAGHAVRKYGEPHYTYDTKAAAARILGLTDDQAGELFQPRETDWMGHAVVRELTREQAAKGVRHFALTGEVEFA